MKAISSRASGKGGSRNSALHGGMDLEVALYCAMCMLSPWTVSSLAGSLPRTHASQCSQCTSRPVPVGAC